MMAAVVGADGCKSGWFYFRREGSSLTFGIAENLQNLVEQTSPGSRIFIDIPIGLVDHGESGRDCEIEARRALGRPRASSVFSAPAFPVLAAESFLEAKKLSSQSVGKMLSQQAYAIIPKIREVNAYLASNQHSNTSVREVHPEVCFWALNNKKAMIHPKTKLPGYTERIDVLGRFLPDIEVIVHDPLEKYTRSLVARDDILDALVALVVGCTSNDKLQTLPSRRSIDSRGLPMEMVFTEEPNEHAL